MKLNSIRSRLHCPFSCSTEGLDRFVDIVLGHFSGFDEKYGVTAFAGGADGGVAGDFLVVCLPACAS